MEYIVSHYALNVRRACRLIKQTRSVQYYRSVKDPRHDLRSRMHEIARTRVRYGYRRIHVLLKRDGWQLGKNQMYRLYREEHSNRVELAFQNIILKWLTRRNARIAMRWIKPRLWDPVVASITVLGSDVYFDPSYPHWWSSTSCCEQHAARPHSEYT